MKAVITPAQLQGSVNAISSKSQAHRMLICAALADAPSKIICRDLSRDIEATAECLRALGCRMDRDEENGYFSVTPLKRGIKDRVITIDAGESGSTLRFLLPVVCALGKKTRIVMHGRLPERPLSPLWEELEAHGAILKKNPDGSVETGGQLSGTDWQIDADVSSQFVSGLLFALPLLRRSGTEERNAAFRRLRLKGCVESEGYIRMTMNAMKEFGIAAEWSGDTILIPEQAAYLSPGEMKVEGDWSNGAFWICAAAMSEKKLEITGLDPDSAQGDRAVLQLRDRILGRTTKEETVEVDAKNVPDLVPVLSVLAASVHGTTVFTHAQRLRIKESDRIRSTVDMLAALGAEARETEDGLAVAGTGKLKGGCVDSCNDHRIAMSAAVASIICCGEVTVKGAEAVQKSYPGFWEDLKALGGKFRIE